MSTTQPIRNPEMLQQFKNYYLTQEPNPRNYVLIILGLNTALRITDLLHLKWSDLYIDGKLREHLFVHERKTGKENQIYLNQEARTVLLQYEASSRNREQVYIFEGQKGTNAPLSRCQAFRIIKHAAISVNLGEHISCHSLRKTFGYHAWKQGTAPALLMNIFNHSSYDITTRYLGIEQDDKDSVFEKIKL